MNDLDLLFEQSDIARGWSAATQDHYRNFTHALNQTEPLSIKIGKGGLSYYRDTETGPVFVCHFNAAPQKARPDLGFADFRFDALRDRLDMDAVLHAMQTAALPDVHVKVNKLWCSLHFPHTMIEQVADLFSKHIISKVVVVSGN
jgi:hypothetical protein